MRRDTGKRITEKEMEKTVKKNKKEKRKEKGKKEERKGRWPAWLGQAALVLAAGRRRCGRQGGAPEVILEGAAWYDRGLA